MLYTVNTQQHHYTNIIIIIITVMRLDPLVDPFRSHVPRSLFRGLPWFPLPVGQQCFITLGNVFRGILFTCCVQLLLYCSNLSKIGVICNSFAICSFEVNYVSYCFITLGNLFRGFYLHVVSSFSCIPAVCPKIGVILTPLQFVYIAM
jgi:hypothetical protein